MFDMGFTEMVLIGIVALIVIGPERLPGVARTAGKYVGRLKRFMTTVKADVEQELRADELRQILSQQQKELDSLKSTISEAGQEIEKETNLQEAVGESVTAGTETGSDAAADSPPPTPSDSPADEAATASDAATADDAATAGDAGAGDQPARKSGS